MFIWAEIIIAHQFILKLNSIEYQIFLTLFSAQTYHSPKTQRRVEPLPY